MENFDDPHLSGDYLNIDIAPLQRRPGDQDNLQQV